MAVVPSVTSRSEGDSDDVAPSPGWYTDDTGTPRWWDGTAWTQTVQHEQPVPADLPAPNERPHLLRNQPVDGPIGAAARGVSRKVWWALAWLLSTALVATGAVLVFDRVMNNERSGRATSATITSVSRQYVVAFLDADMERVCDLSTWQVKQRMFFRSMAQTSGYVVDDCRGWFVRYQSFVEDPQRQPYRDLTVAEPEVTGDRAVVRFSYREVGSGVRSGHLTVVRDHNQWRVSSME